MARRRSPGRALALAAALFVAACFSERGDPLAGLPDDCALAVDSTFIGTTHTVVAIRGFAFQPSEVRIPAGTSVTWVNCEDAGTEPHTSTADDQTWGSSLLSPGQSFSVAFYASGSHSYHCAPHPGMRGTIIVE